MAEGVRLLSLHLAAYRLRAVGASGHGAIDAIDLEGGLGQGLPGAVPDLQGDGENVGRGIVAQGKGCYLQTLGVGGGAQQVTIAQRQLAVFTDLKGITSSDFYKRISTLQNEWFTPHSIAKLSFGDVKVIKQNDDSFIANVIWNYYISNGSLEREYHGAYQMSFLKVNGAYKLAGFAIDNELNPDNEGAYYD